jgi:hypothetical protein
MNSQLGSIWPRLVIFEGIMGSGKSTATLSLAQRLESTGITAVGITEGVNPHPIRFDWVDVPWSEMPPMELARSSLAKWRSYVESALGSDPVSIVDGQLFHGNLTSLLLLEGGTDLIGAYCRDIVAVIKPLRPLLIYFYQDDVDSAVRAISEERGEKWVSYQVDWKLGSPYASRRGLVGIDGLITLYRDYRALTDQLFAALDIPKISIETSGHEWSKYDDIIYRAVRSPRLAESGGSVTRDNRQG